MKRSLAAIVIPIIIFLASPIFSHHYILVPDKFIYKKGDSLQVHLMVGEPFHFEFERELQHQMTPHFMLYTATDSVNLLQVMPDSSNPILKVVVGFEGFGLIEMQRRASAIEEKPGAFQKYLDEEKITGISFDSTEWKRSIVKEKYSRCIKSLVLSGEPGNENLCSKVIGQRLELVLLNNPYALSHGERLTVKLLWEGQPLAGRWVTASFQEADGSLMEIAQLTDKKGMTSFNVTAHTVYYLHVVNMIKLKEGSDADFESVWASYSFQTSGN